MMVTSLAVLGRLSIAPPQGIVVVGHGTGVTGSVAVPPRRCAASVIDLPRLCAGSGTPPLKLCAVPVLVGGVARSPEHVVSDCVAVDGDVAVCNGDPDWVGSEPRLVVPSPVVPRPFVPRAVTPVFGELPRLDDADEGIEEEFAPDVVVAAEFGALVTPEPLTELHGVDVLSAPTPEVVKLVVGLSPAPSKLDSAAAPEPSLQGAGLVNGAGVIWELLPGVWPKFAPSGDVAPTPPGLDTPVCAALGELPKAWPKSDPSGDVVPMLPGLDVPVCAALWPTPSAVVASSTAAARKDFI
jgi:hypothetical protein